MANGANHDHHNDDDEAMVREWQLAWLVRFGLTEWNEMNDWLVWHTSCNCVCVCVIEYNNQKSSFIHHPIRLLTNEHWLPKIEPQQKLQTNQSSNH